MNKVRLLIASVSLILAPAQALGQTAAEIVDRYARVSGLDGFEDMAGRSVFMEINIASQGGDAALTGIICYPLKMRLEMSLAGQDMLMVLNGRKGWLVVDGAKQPLPARQVEQLARQNDILANLRFDKGSFDFTLLEPVAEDGALYDVVRAVPKFRDTPVKEQVVCFDRETGFIANARNTVEHDGKKIAVEVVYGEIVAFGPVRIPGRIATAAEGIAPTEVTIKNVVPDYPVEEWMFAEPE